MSGLLVEDFCFALVQHLNVFGARLCKEANMPQSERPAFPRCEGLVCWQIFLVTRVDRGWRYFFLPSTLSYSSLYLFSKTVGIKYYYKCKLSTLLSLPPGLIPYLDIRFTPRVIAWPRMCKKTRVRDHLFFLYVKAE